MVIGLELNVKYSDAGLFLLVYNSCEFSGLLMVEIDLWFSACADKCGIVISSL